MRINRNAVRRWGLLLAVVAAVNTLTTVAPVVPAQAADGAYCECVKYVKTRYALTHIGDAFLWETYLPQEGFTKMSVTTVRVGDIAVWDRTEEPQVGHIAIVQAIYGSSQGLAMTFRGAHQRGTPQFTHNGCNNVTDWVSSSAWSTAAFFHR
ncbi:hypothetical protein F4553_000600 [Allocatelliglobosispora scoriae]|uniref:Peptidase C51 domain-containing protein n=1 Tax=Allocatelliglobosispora scoriae TaxID=643052 RepID=A0A841BK00_9ACTN|nr:CHAP domain-containing protein [Allocatelliglobosispora scoriae]MBB5867221.1 hypothetical protein [Allocatelliglobosispora scoriae]